VPEGFHDHHVMYVWVDALSNYLTGVNALMMEKDAPPHLNKFWPANVHIIGKDILWFHTVIWPCLLMSAGLPLPTTVFAHGFVNDKEGKKMSKSMGNVVDPHDMLDKVRKLEVLGIEKCSLRCITHTTPTPFTW
jgi:methionyl-tRNA synthetase